MAHGGARPKRLEERYEDVAGPFPARQTHYLARRHLGFLPAEFDALPWHERRMFIEGLIFEFTDEEPDEWIDGDDSEQLTSAFGVTVRTA